MKCVIVRQNIDRYFYEKPGDLDTQIKEHLDACQDCNMYFREHEKAREVISRIATYEPILKDPSGLTDDIMTGLSDSERTQEPANKMTPVTIFKSIHPCRHRLILVSP